MPLPPVTDLGAGVLLFAIDTESNWTDYDILFQHWRDRGQAEKIRERLWTVSALTPPDDEIEYLRAFRQQAWRMFTDCLYDDASATGASDDPVRVRF